MLTIVPATPPAVEFHGNHPYVIAQRCGTRVSGHYTAEAAIEAVKKRRAFSRIYGVHQGRWEHLGLWYKGKKISG